MGWGDIDFAFIIPGAATAASEVSFALYLNTFSEALDERINMTDRGTPTLLGITFTAGENDNADFATRFRALITGYKDLWDDHIYYENTVLTDPANFATYEITDADIIALITQEVWDVFDNPAGFSITDIYTAAVLNAMYTFYLNTGVLSQDPPFPSRSNTPTQNVPTFKFTGTSYNYDANENVGAVNEAYASVLLGSPWTLTDNNQSPSLLSIFFTGRRTTSGGGARWSTAFNNNAISHDGSECFLLAKDLDDNILSMDYTPLFQLNRNVIQSTGFADIQYTAEFPLTLAGGSILIPWADKGTSQTANGTRKLYHFRPSGPTGPLTLRDETITPAFFSETQSLSMDLPGVFFIDVNNSALEFFIP